MSLHLIDLRSNVLCLTTFYSISSVYSYLCCLELSTSPFTVWNLSDPKVKFSFYALIMNNKILLSVYLYPSKQSPVVTVLCLVGKRDGE